MIDRERVMKELSWLIYNFPQQKDPKDAADKMCNAINAYCSDALSLLKEQEALTAGVWHKWPDEKPEDYVDSTIPEGEGCWEITCLSLSRNGRTYLQKRIRFINWDTENCHWSHWKDYGSAGWWMFIPEPPKEDEDG